MAQCREKIHRDYQFRHLGVTFDEKRTFMHEKELRLKDASGGVAVYGMKCYENDETPSVVLNVCASHKHDVRSVEGRLRDFVETNVIHLLQKLIRKSREEQARAVIGLEGTLVGAGGPDTLATRLSHSYEGEASIAARPESTGSCVSHDNRAVLWKESNVGRPLPHLGVVPAHILCSRKTGREEGQRDSTEKGMCFSLRDVSPSAVTMISRGSRELQRKRKRVEEWVQHVLNETLRIHSSCDANNQHVVIARNTESRTCRWLDMLSHSIDLYAGGRIGCVDEENDSPRAVAQEGSTEEHSQSTPWSADDATCEDEAENRQVGHPLHENSIPSESTDSIKQYNLPATTLSEFYDIHVYFWLVSVAIAIALWHLLEFFHYGSFIHNGYMM